MGQGIGTEGLCRTLDTDLRRLSTLLMEGYSQGGLVVLWDKQIKGPCVEPETSLLLPESASEHRLNTTTCIENIAVFR